MKTKMKTYGLVLLFIFCIGICFNFNGIYASQNMNSSEITKKAKEMLGDENGDIDVTKLVTEYEELTKEYSNDEIADMIEENKDVLEKKGISSEAISDGTEVLRNMEPEKVTKILKEDIKIKIKRRKKYVKVKINSIRGQKKTFLQIGGHGKFIQERWKSNCLFRKLFSIGRF